MTPRQLLALLALIAALMVAGAVAGYVAAPSLARANYAVLVSEHYVREKGAAPESPQESLQTRAIRVLGLTPDVLFAEARAVQAQFRVGAPIFGAWCGLAAGLTIAASLRRKRRIEYDTHPARCLGCARCYEVCPVEHKHRGTVRGEEWVLPAASGNASCRAPSPLPKTAPPQIPSPLGERGRGEGVARQRPCGSTLRPDRARGQRP